MSKRDAPKGRKSTGKKRSPPKGPCSVPDCGRTTYARNLCQTHHRQLLTTGKVGSIRPYRKRSKETVKFAGLRLSSRCTKKLQQRADERGTSVGATIADVLQAWAERTTMKRTRKGNRHG